MKYIKFTIKLEAPVILSESGGVSFFSYTKTYIPGTVIRGMFASNFIKKKDLDMNNAHDNQDFKDFFLSRKISYGNAYIASVEPGGGLKQNIPLPLSLHHEKNNDQKLIDLLLEKREEKGIGQTKALQGYGRLESNNLHIQEVSRHLFFHHMRNKETGSPEPGRFFNYECLAAGQSFMGEIRFSDDELADSFFNMFKEDKAYYIGRSKNSQYGRISLELEKPADWKLPEDINKVPSFQVNDGRIVLTFVSDAILIDEAGRYCTDKTAIETYLQKLIDIGPHLSIERAFIRIKEIENFVSVWKLRRPTDLAIRAGSCLLIKVNKNNQNDTIRNKIFEHSFLGIGERTIEGFGRFEINLQKENLQFNAGNNPSSRATVVTTDSPASKTADTLNNLSDSGKKIITDIIINHLKKQVITNAYAKAEEVTDQTLRETSKSCLARLERALIQFDDLEKFKEEFLNNLTKNYEEKLRGIRLKNSQNLFEILLKTDPDKLLPPQDGLLNILIKCDLNGLKRNLVMVYLRKFVTALRYRQRAL